MTERAYTVSELIALRRLCRSLWIGGGRSIAPGEEVVAVEEMVRTHMMAGHTADDLKPEVDKMFDDLSAMREAQRMRVEELLGKGNGSWHT